MAAQPLCDEQPPITRAPLEVEHAAVALHARRVAPLADAGAEHAAVHELLGPAGRAERTVVRAASHTRIVSSERSARRPARAAPVVPPPRMRVSTDAGKSTQAIVRAIRPRRQWQPAGRRVVRTARTRPPRVPYRRFGAWSDACYTRAVPRGRDHATGGSSDWRCCLQRRRARWRASRRATGTGPPGALSSIAPETGTSVGLRVRQREDRDAGRQPLGDAVADHPRRVGPAAIRGRASGDARRPGRRRRRRQHRRRPHLHRERVPRRSLVAPAGRAAPCSSRMATGSRRREISCATGR